MAVTYKKLWHILLDKNMKKKDFQEAIGLTGYAMNKLSKDNRLRQIFSLKYADTLTAPLMI